MGTLITILILAALIGLSIRQIYKTKKSGRSISCGGDCSHCAGCNFQNLQTGESTAPKKDS